MTACRSCGCEELAGVLSLGRTPLANALIPAERLSEAERTYPLDVVFCPRCSLVQITETVPREELFSHYVYFSSFSDTMVRHAEELAGKLVRSHRLGAKSLVVEIASNDGYLLQHYRRAGVPVIGIEPASNVAQVAERERGIPTVAAFFDEPLARRLAAAGKAADIVHANNVLAHVADLHGVLRGIRVLLKDEGLAVIEVPYVKTLIDNCEFDTIYHEHLCYFSLTALSHLFEAHGLRLRQVEQFPIHGGTLRITANRSGSTPEGADATSVAGFLEDERRWGVDSLTFYRGFAERVEAVREELLGLLRRLKGKGLRIAAYGASAKGSTLLNYCGIGGEILDYVVDRSTIKQGHYTPGTRLPIYPPQRLLQDMPDAVLLLTWNFASEILQQQKAFRERGGRFIIPVPRPELI